MNDFVKLKKIEETEHPYYCEDQNYRASFNDGIPVINDSFEEFMEEMENTDFDMNLLFRFDIKKDMLTEYPDKLSLHTYWVMQRKGDFRVFICPIEDNPETLERLNNFLEKRYDHLKRIWS